MSFSSTGLNGENKERHLLSFQVQKQFVQQTLLFDATSWVKETLFFSKSSSVMVGQQSLVHHHFRIFCRRVPPKNTPPPKKSDKTEVLAKNVLFVTEEGEIHSCH